MECNKEEAFKAKELAEKKMQNGDFPGALRMGQKAQRLFPDLDNISQLLMVCQVHCSALKKLNGSELDWYEVLQIEKFSDEAVVKKQFRKLALSLHPDKNKFPGAEAAFKFIGEANRVLTDPTKRTAYDVRYRVSLRSAVPKPPPDQSNKNSFVKKQHGAVNKFSNASQAQNTSSHAYQPPEQQAFWTSCPYCHVRYQYFKEYIKKMLRCQNCLQPFIAHDINIPPGAAAWNQSLNEKRVPNQGPSKVLPQSYAGEHSGMGFPHSFPGPELMPKGERTADVGVTKPKVKVKTTTCADGESKPYGKVNGHVDVNDGTGGYPVPDVKKTKESGTSEGACNKRCRKSVEESSKNFEKSSKAGNEENVVKVENGSNISALNSGSSVGHHSRRSSRQKQHISYNENFDDDDFVVPPPKRSRGNSSSNLNDVEMKEASLGGRVQKEDTSAAFVASVLNGNNEEVKEKASSSHEEIPLNKKSETGDFKAKGEESSMLERNGAKLEKDDEQCKNDTSELNSSEVLEPEVFICPDPDFSNFERERIDNVFAVNQMWAIYDSHDGMPRFYARVRKVFTGSFKLRITWLEAISDNKAEQQGSDEDLPFGCGLYENGDTEETVDRLMFSHQVHYIHGGRRGTFLIYPKKGETWALFKEWNTKWSLEPEKHRPPYQFEYVEVMTEFSQELGVGVAYLGKVKGFVSIFERANCDEVISFRIQPDELHRFSHRIPSSRMTGKEGEGVPEGSFELDTAALPSNFASLVDSEKSSISKNIESDPKKGTSTSGSALRESMGSCKYNNQVDAGQQEGGGVHKVASPVKLTQKGISAYFQANGKISTPKKQGKDKFIAVSLTPRRSPRDLSKEIKKVDSSRSASQDTNKHVSTSSGCRDGQPGVSSCQPDDRTRLHVKDGRFISPLKGSSSLGGCRVVEVEPYDFKKDKSEDKFKVGQIWAVHTNEDVVPRSYVQVKRMESAIGFRLHVVMLEACTFRSNMRQAVSCGSFRVMKDKTTVLPVSAFSHKVIAKSTWRNTFEIYPKKDEIWAVYKRWNHELKCPDQEAEECDIVQVIEDNGSSFKALVLIPDKKDYTVYKSPSLKRSESSTIDIPRTEFFRFSHQCLAHRHGEESNSRSRGCWQLDPASLPGTVILLE